MLSLLEHCCNTAEVNIYILDGGISSANQKLLKKTAEKFSANLIFISADILSDNSLKQNRGSDSTFSRLYLTTLLPESIDKLLYLDCDILVMHDLNELYDTCLDGYFCAGVNDCVSINHLKNIGLTADDNYFNAGVLLINLDMWRKENVEKNFSDFAAKYHGNVPYADQGIINGVLYSHSLKLSPKYNCYTAMFDFSYKDLTVFRKPQKYYSEKEISDAKEAPSIVHFTTSFLSLRPWVKGCKHIYTDMWLEYKARSPWADIPLKNDTRKTYRKILTRIYKALPHNLSVTIIGWLHAIFIPILKGLIR